MTIKKEKRCDDCTYYCIEKQLEEGNKITKEKFCNRFDKRLKETTACEEFKDQRHVEIGNIKHEVDLLLGFGGFLMGGAILMAILSTNHPLALIAASLSILAFVLTIIGIIKKEQRINTLKEELK